MAKADYIFLGRRLKKAREMKNLTQEKLAEMVGCTTAHISHIETGNTIPSLKIIIDILNALNISSDLLFCDYLEHSAHVFQNELDEIMKTYSENEIKFIIESAKENLALFRKYQ